MTLRPTKPNRPLARFNAGLLRFACGQAIWPALALLVAVGVCLAVKAGGSQQ